MSWTKIGGGGGEGWLFWLNFTLSLSVFQSFVNIDDIIIIQSVPMPSLDDAGADTQRDRSGSGSSTGSQSPVLRRSNKEVFIRSFVFQPELPIRIDYEAKGFKTEMVSL